MASKSKKPDKEDLSALHQEIVTEAPASSNNDSFHGEEKEILPLEYYVNRASQLSANDEEDESFEMDLTSDINADFETEVDNQKEHMLIHSDQDADEDGESSKLSLVDYFDPNDPVSLYFREINKVPLLSHEEEISLAKRIEAGRDAQEILAKGSITRKRTIELQRLIDDGWAAREHLITANFRLVVSVAKKYVGRGVPFLDLIQDGNVGLIRATKKFDYRRGFRFSTYATWWIRQAVSRGVADHGRTIRLPVHLGDQINRLWRTSHKLTQKLGRDATIEELAQVLELPPKNVEELMRVSQRPLSLELPTDDDENELSDYTPDEILPAPMEAVSELIMQEHVQEIIDTLPPREARILQLRYGLLDGKSRTLGEVGRKMGVTRERVRQIEAQALRRLRQPKIRRELQDYILE